jgi:squalene monooxygenase
MLRALAEEHVEICANHAVKTHRCTAPGVALVGDSGGCSHPLTAAGMTIALNDIRILATELDRGGPRPASIDPALVRYEARRYDYVRAREILAEGLYDVFRRGDDGARAMRGGLFRYWTSGPRARAASLSLLSGRESRLRAFVAEYLWVVGASAAGVLGGATEAPEAGGRRALVAGLGRTAIEQLRRTTAHVYREVLGRRVAQPAAALSGAWRGAARQGAASGLQVIVEPSRAEPGAEVTTPSTAGLS